MKEMQISDSALQSEYSNDRKIVGIKFASQISRRLEELDGVIASHDTKKRDFFQRGWRQIISQKKSSLWNANLQLF